MANNHAKLLEQNKIVYIGTSSSPGHRLFWESNMAAVYSELPAPFLTFVTEIIVVFTFKAHHQREESIQRLLHHRSRMNGDRHMLSEEERV